MIPRLHLPLLEPEDVVRHLGHQEKHWKAGRSAHALTNLWFRSKGLPRSVQSILGSHPTLAGAGLVDAFLERQVDLGTPGRPSQTDLLAIIGLQDRIAILAVEGKAGETFGDLVSRWQDGSEGKTRRLSALCETLGISDEVASSLRYQLLHRSASAIYEARRYRTDVAVLLVQSFADDDASFTDYSKFLKTIGMKDQVRPGILSGPIYCKGVSFYAGWIDEGALNDGGELDYLTQLRNYAARLSQYCDRLRVWCDQRM